MTLNLTDGSRILIFENILNNSIFDNIQKTLCPLENRLNIGNIATTLISSCMQCICADVTC